MPQEFRIPFKPKKSEMPKKSRIPQTASRRTSGRFYNQMNDKNKSGDDQRVLNNVSNTSGHTLTPEGIKRPVGWVHTWGTLLAMVPPLDLPDQQMVLKRTPPAFEVSTRIDVRRDGNQTRIHSFVSTSTINRERIQSLNMNQTMSHPAISIAPSLVSANSLFSNQTLHNRTSTSTQQDIDVAKRAHELSVFFHQKVHDLYQLMNCSTTRRTDQVNTWIVTGESVEQTSFTTVCQDAVGRAEAQNNQGMKQESEDLFISTHPVTGTNVQGTSQFSAEETAQKLSQIFQDSFENKHNVTIDTQNYIHNQVTETFWTGLTERFYQFFSQHEHTPYAQEQEDTNSSLMSYFVDLLLQTFSVDYGKQVPTNSLLEKNLNDQWKTSFSNPAIQKKKKQSEVTPEKVSDPVLETTPEILMKNESILNPEKEGFMPQIWQLATDFYKVVDGFLQQSIGLQFLGAEAMPSPTTRIPFLESEGNNGTFNETQIRETTTESSQVNGTTASELEVIQEEENDVTQEINEKIQAFLQENADDPTKTVVKEEKKPSLPEWNSEQKENIRKKLMDFFTEKGIDCQGADTNKLIDIVGDWALLEGANPVTLDTIKIKQLAKLFLDMGEETVISEEEAYLTVTTWVHVMMEDNRNRLSATVAFGTEQTEQAEQADQANQANQTEQTRQPEETSMPTSISPDKSKADTVQWRDPNVKKQVEEFLKQKKLLSDQPTKELLLIALGEWVTQEENKKTIFNLEKLEPLAKVILKSLKLYGGKIEENISNKDAELTIMKWVFETILGSSMEAYMVKTLVSAPDIDRFTIGRLRNLFTIENLEKEGLIQLDAPILSHEHREIFRNLWNLLLQQELPNYFVDRSGLADDVLISDYQSLMQLTGAKILKEGGYPQSFSQEDYRLMGEHFWQTILEKGMTNYEELRSLLMPALLAIAQLEPDRLREALAAGTYKEVAISTFIGYQQAGYFKFVENQKILNRLYKVYQEALLQWRRKDAIAAKVAQKCRDKYSFMYFHIIKQNYLIGSDPCPDIDWSPVKLEVMYTKLTKNVSETYFPLDKKLIEFALNAVDKKERAFIFSKTTTLYEGFAELKNETHYTGGAPGTGGMLLINLKGRVTWEDTTLSLDKTDLFVAVQGNEERWYALKRLEDEGGYLLYRVDQDPLSYLKYGLFNRKDLWEKGYRQEGNEIRIGDKYFQFSARVNRSKKLSHGVEIEPFIETLSRKHSDQLYKQLYDSGNDKADLEKIWDVIKHFIPFYDCVVGIIDQDIGKAITSCAIDALLFIPVLGQITSLNMKFALGVARAFARGGIKGVIKSSTSFLPKVAEIRKIVFSLARTIDPGFELVIGGGRLVTKKLVNFKNEFWVTKKTKDLLERIETMEKSREALKKFIVMGRLPENGLVVPVRIVKAHLYSRVTNLETAEVFGDLYMLKGNQLELYRGPAKFTADQLKLIDRLEVKLDKDQISVLEENPNPQAYGVGILVTVAKEGEETKRFIRMKGKHIPVSITAIEGHGIRLDIYDPHTGKFLPVNYNGVEWYFEASTSPFVSKEVETKIAGMVDQFETRKDPSVLSASDCRGLMWEKSDRSYIKIKEHYIPLILLDNELNRYHLVKKNYNEEMTVLRFDAEKRQFRFETELEKKQVREELFLKQIESPSRRSKGYLQKKTAKDSVEESYINSQLAALQENRNILLPPPNELPTISLGHSEKWTRLRGAVAYPPDFWWPRVEDYRVALGEFSGFLPECPPMYFDDSEWLKDRMMKDILMYLPQTSKLDFRIYVGFNSDRVPEFIKLFREKLVEGFMEAEETCKKVIETCENLLKEETFVETLEGQYLTNMFKLGGLTNQEEILVEIVKRLKSIAEKGGEFLQQTVDFGFDNVWIVSTDLVRLPGSQEYRSLYKSPGPEGMAVRGDPECRMFIFADAFHLDPDIEKGAQLAPVAREVILHETTHIMSAKEDVIYYSRVESGFSRSGEDVINNYIAKYPNLLESVPFKLFVNHLAVSLNKPTISVWAVANEIYRNPMLRANFQMMDVEMVMTLLRDIADRRGFNQRPRVTRSVKEVESEKESSEPNVSEKTNRSMFLYLALPYILGNGIFERNLQLNKTQEQTTIRTTDNTEEKTANKEVPITVGTTKSVKTAEITKDTTNQPFLNLVATSTEKSIRINQTTIDQQINKKQKKLNLQPKALAK
ncbi:hypothetical protein A5844_000192 [Enterococcus sp. 10A9_DIV0425]|uniref:Uncharacterized protein n=1 Tax=Candidatus Enterococcus wittei TaxID=1987383 RepID=A0A2C9XQH9_9ENTE|nr:hypothetical protein [Enterococcus sp. 10A9_DIV0425]OTP11977.1 hypothetical protein A5844_000192 [Enterococcus sp. 10A9_DIV0425]